ncbi:multiple sugar transport system substrate-binding protein [Deinococcus metalli]|uniref:ABC transporter substrate-binding protein n=1 Tax=Deinococcus metalli TaxID=1141878 RepID=A0A7W8NQH8_9DEIO|nr:sugar ABC transporter substrate-binding protein [Deinococcus metalli]MBB5376805.1 multiple sugar transport system substrate-binding protein [Deinococcus metalli]GHF45477.1 ABC transporter substrate-binding protein [Deinococcus metalli]
MNRITLLASLTTLLAASAQAQSWSLATAAAPYKGTTVKAIFLDRPGYKAAAALIPQFEKETGIKISYETVPYESTNQRYVLDFTSGGGADLVLSDVVWIGQFADAGWMVPLDKFTKDPKLADPALNLKGFFPVLLNSFGTWNNKVYGLPFDNYSGLMYYNKCTLKAAGFNAPPKTWDELLTKYAPKLTGNGKYGFALQSRRGETQSADSFMRTLWLAGGSLIDAKTFEPNLQSAASQKGLKFRQDLMKFMPPGVVDQDHAEVVAAFNNGTVPMITEWSAFYPTITDPKQSKVPASCLGVTTEPLGTAGLKPALGGFSLGVNSNSDAKKQAAAYLFIQWITSEKMAKAYVQAGGVSGRQAVYKDPAIRAKYLYVDPMVKSWSAGTAVPNFRPRFAEWPQISQIVAENGTKIMLGQLSTVAGAKAIDDQVKDILTKAGYYNGKKAKLQ